MEAHRVLMKIAVLCLLVAFACAVPSPMQMAYDDEVEHRNIYDAVRAALPGKYAEASVYPRINTTGRPSEFEDYGIHFWGFQTRRDARSYYSGFSVLEPEPERVLLSEVRYLSDSIAGVVVSIVDASVGFGSSYLYLLERDGEWKVVKQELWIVHG